MTESLSRQSLGFDFESPVYRFGPLQTTASNVLCVPIIYGQIKAAGNKIWQSTGTTFNTIIAFGEGPIEEISNVKINNCTLSSKATSSTVVGSSKVALGDGSKNVSSMFTTGTIPTASIVGGLKHTAYLALKVTAGTNVTRSYMNVTADIKGKKIYTYSATGVKSNVPVYSNNPAWCILDFLTSQSGCAMAVSDLDLQSFINSAEYCDRQFESNVGTVSCLKNSKTVTGTNTSFTTKIRVGSQIKIDNIGKTVTAITSDTSLTVDSVFSTTTAISNQSMILSEPRFTLNLILDERKSRNKWLAQMLNTCRGNLMYNAAQKLCLVIEQDDASVQDFTPEDIIVGTERFWTTQKEQKADILKVRYIYPTEQCARVFAVAEADTFLNNPPITQELDLFGVTNFKQASRLAWYYLNQANNCNKFVSFVTTQVALDRTVGDVITLTSTFLGYVKKKMRIVDIAQAQSGQIKIICREHNGAESATLTTDFKDSTGNLIYKLVDQSKKDVTIQYIDPCDDKSPLAISVLGQEITISLQTDADGVIVTPEAEIKAAIKANPAASSLVTVTIPTDNDGSNVVTTTEKIRIAGNNNDLAFSSVEKSSDAGNITIKYTDPYAVNQTLDVTVTNKDINVLLATDANGKIKTTANEIIAKINEKASLLVTVVNEEGSDGTGVVKAMAKTNLVGGTVGLYSDTMGSVEPEFNLIDTNDAFEVPDDVTGFQASQSSDTLQFYWKEVPGSGLTYEIREGSSWDAMSVVKSGLTETSYSTKLIGTGTKYYWIKAITKYGIYSKNTAESILVVTDIPQSNVLVVTDLVSSAEGEFENTHICNRKLKLDFAGSTWTTDHIAETWKTNNTERAYCQNEKWGCPVLTYGIYTSQVYDLGSILNSGFSIIYETYLCNNSGSIVVELRTSNDNINWDDWFSFVSGSSKMINCRYYQLRATFSSPSENQIYLNDCILTVDVPDVIEHYNDLTISDAQVGYLLNFASNTQSKNKKSFNAVPAIVVTPEAQSGIIIVAEYSGKTKESVTVRLKNASTGNFITGRFDCLVKGY